MKQFIIILGFLIVLHSKSVLALHSFGVISDIEIQSRQAEGQKNRSAYQNFITIEQNWSNQNSKFIGQARIFEFYKKINDVEFVLHEVYPAELNYEVNSGSNRWTLGYQSLLLSEGFSLIDTELFHAKNNEISIFSSAEKRNYTTPGISYKFIEDNVSLQMAVFKFDRSEKLSLAQTGLIKESFPSFKEPINQGPDEGQRYDKLIKLMGSNELFDWSTYYCSTYEKRLTLQLNSTTNQLEQVSLPFSSYGVGMSGLIGSLVFRADYQKNIQRVYIDTNNKQTPIDQENINVSLEKSFHTKWRLALILGNSKLNTDIETTTREKIINDAYLNLNYKINNTTHVDLSAFERIDTQTYGWNLALNTKVLENIEIKYGYENYWMGPRSRLSFLDQEDRFYLSIKATVF